MKMRSGFTSELMVYLLVYYLHGLGVIHVVQSVDR